MATALNANAPIFIPATVLKATAVEFYPPFRKEFYGAVVEFGPGATVVSIKLPTDSCSIQVYSIVLSMLRIFKADYSRSRASAKQLLEPSRLCSTFLA